MDEAGSLDWPDAPCRHGRKQGKGSFLPLGAVCCSCCSLLGSGCLGGQVGRLGIRWGHLGQSDPGGRYLCTFVPPADLHRTECLGRVAPTITTTTTTNSTNGRCCTPHPYHMYVRPGLKSIVRRMDRTDRISPVVWGSKSVVLPPGFRSLQATRNSKPALVGICPE